MNSSKQTAALSAGYVLAGLFVLLSAARDLWGYFVLREAPVHATLFASFTVTVIIAQMWNRVRPGPALREKNTQNLWIDTFALNFTTLVSWIATFEGLSRLLPTTLASLTVGGIPIATLVLDRAFRGKQITFQSLINAGLIIIGMCIMSLREFSFGSSTESIWRAGVGILWSLMAAVFAAANNVFARRLNDRGFSGAEVFATRFWLLLGICAVWCLVERAALPTRTTQWIQLTVLGLVGIALPIICLQLSIEFIGPRLVGFLIAAIPALVAIGESLLPGRLTNPKRINLALLAGVSLVILGISREIFQGRKKSTK